MFLIIISVLAIFISSCKDENSSVPGELDNPKVMIVFCQSSLSDTLRLVEYEYDNDKLTSETTIQNGKVTSKKTFRYNSDNLIITEVNKLGRRKIENTFVYNHINQLINVLQEVTNYDSNGQIVDESEREAPREYENNQLVKEWESWGGFNTYEYNNDGKVKTKIDHTGIGQKHHITNYRYWGDLLLEERKMTRNFKPMYLRTYIYDAQKRLVNIKEGEKNIEENDYDGNKLIEKRTFYFGIDPCYYPCCGNFVYKYEY